ncbi:MAG: EAL domain-containing protein [Planctomycetes bacterium]|nr:EAL domain-containing protein [Planctomycetota bacterium]
MIIKNNTLHILLVEDELDHVELIRRSFLAKTEQIEISVAHSIHEAKTFLSKTSPDIMLLDYLLPDGRGTELLSEDKTNLSYPIVIMTSHGNEQVAVEAMKKGALDYIVKSRETIANMPRICERALREWKLIIENKRAEGNVRKLFHAIEQSQNLVIITDIHGVIEYVNPRFISTTGYTKEEVIGKKPNILKSGNTPVEEYRRLWDTILYGKEWQGEFHNRKKNGELYWERASITPIRDEKGTITHFLGIKEDITDRKQFEQQLTHMELHDPLTNLYNRKHFREELKFLIAQAEKRSFLCALLFLDIDNFKYINETLGHQTGDELLIEIADLLGECIRKTDTLCRLGGDEFGIILPYTSSVQAQTTSNKILSNIKNYSLSHTKTKHYDINVSIGIVMFPEHGTDADTLISYADLAMYQAKEKGKGCVCFFSPDHAAQLEAMITWKQRIQDALAHNKFVLYLQPIMDLTNNTFSRYEVLLRMKGDNGEIILPCDFLKTAERFGLIRDIDRWVTIQSIQLISEHQLDSKGIHLEVNLSGKAFMDEILLSMVQQKLDKSKIKPGSLIFEITETAVIENMSEAQHFLSTLKNMGCRFALDDFGNGFSSFSYLKHLPVDYLKIDGNFIHELPVNTVDQHLVKAMVEVARGLGKYTIAEYVGCEKTVALLQELGVDFAQGYYIGNPKPASEALVS